MRSWVAFALLLAACSPVSQGGANLEDDYRIPAPSPIGRHDEASGGSGPIVLFLNFGGASIKRVANDGTSENSATNSSWIPDTYSVGSSKSFAAFDATPYASYYTASQAKQLIIDKVTAWYAAFNVEVVTTRPTSGSYTMMMIGDSVSSFISSPASGQVGVAPLDCGNNANVDSLVNIGFDFAVSVLAIQPVTSQATAEDALFDIAATAAHEAGHSFGLEHISNTADLMYPTTNAANQTVSFVNSSTALYASATSACDSTTKEDTYSRLLNNLGPYVAPVDMAHAPDMAQPKSDMAEPTDMAKAKHDLAGNTSDLAEATDGMSSSGGPSSDLSAASGDAGHGASCGVECVKAGHGCDFGGEGRATSLGLLFASAMFLVLRRRARA